MLYPSWRKNYRRTLERNYTFGVAPTVLRNTLAAGRVIDNIPPTHYIKTQGAAAETNKIYEVQLEAGNANSLDGVSAFRGPGSTVDSDFPSAIACQMCGQVDIPASLTTDTAFYAIEMFSQGASILSDSPGNGSAQVRQFLKDRTHWQLFWAVGGGQPAVKVDFTIPDAAPSLSGHLVQMYWDPFALFVQAVVDGSVRATIPITGPTVFSADVLHIGLLMYTGTQNAACTIKAQWSAVNVINWLTDQIGSGII